MKLHNFGGLMLAIGGFAALAAVNWRIAVAFVCAVIGLGLLGICYGLGHLLHHREKHCDACDLWYRQ
jgi:hypothetical protein